MILIVVAPFETPNLISTFYEFYPCFSVHRHLIFWSSEFDHELLPVSGCAGEPLRPGRFIGAGRVRLFRDDLEGSFRVVRDMIDSDDSGGRSIRGPIPRRRLSGASPGHLRSISEASQKSLRSLWKPLRGLPKASEKHPVERFRKMGPS